MNCKGTTKDGRPCQAQPRPGSTTCPWHSDELAERRQEWSRRGGANSSSKARAKKLFPAEAMTTAETLGLLGIVFRGVIAGRVEPRVANAAAHVARAMNDILKTSEIEQRLAELEEAAGLNTRRQA